MNKTMGQPRLGARVDRVVPLPVEVVRLDRQGRKSLFDIFLPVGYLRRSSRARTMSPPRLVVFAMRFTTVSYVRRGQPRQLMLMNENSRCSTLFHLLVPGGRWPT